MRKVLLLLSLVAYLANAQDVKVTRTRQIKGLEKEDYSLSGVSPDGKKLLITGGDFRGLYLKDIRGRGIVKINDDPGSGYEPKYSGDGKFIFFRTDDFSEMKKKSAMSQYEVSSGKTTLLTPSVRNMTPPVAVGNRVVYSANDKLETKDPGGVDLKNSGGEVFVIVEDLIPVLYKGTERVTLKPNGEASYIWASLSPDKTMMLYTVVGKGTFICDLNGKVIYSPGRINAPRWLTNSIIVGMDDKDDGYRTVSSEIVVYSLKSRQMSYLTRTEGRMEMYPHPFSDGEKLAIQTPGGELFIMHLTVK